MKKNLLICFVLTACLFGLFSGCKGRPANPDGRLDVSGKITLNGGAFVGADMCIIAFIPIDAGDPPSGVSSTMFDPKTGKYLLTLQDGLKPGKYKVAISARGVYDKKTKAPVTPETAEGNEYFVTLVPPEFNKESKIEFEVVKGKKNVFDFDVKAELKTTP